MHIHTHMYVYKYINSENKKLPYSTAEVKAMTSLNVLNT